MIKLRRLISFRNELNDLIKKYKDIDKEYGVLVCRKDMSFEELVSKLR